MQPSSICLYALSSKNDPFISIRAKRGKHYAKVFLSKITWEVKTFKWMVSPFLSGFRSLLTASIWGYVVYKYKNKGRGWVLIQCKIKQLRKNVSASCRRKTIFSSEVNPLDGALRSGLMNTSISPSPRMRIVLFLDSRRSLSLWFWWTDNKIYSSCQYTWHFVSMEIRLYARICPDAFNITYIGGIAIIPLWQITILSTGLSEFIISAGLIVDLLTSLQVTWHRLFRVLVNIAWRGWDANCTHKNNLIIKEKRVSVQFVPHFLM